MKLQIAVNTRNVGVTKIAVVINQLKKINQKTNVVAEAAAAAAVDQEANQEVAAAVAAVKNQEAEVAVAAAKKNLAKAAVVLNK